MIKRSGRGRGRTVFEVLRGRGLALLAIHDAELEVGNALRMFLLHLEQVRDELRLGDVVDLSSGLRLLKGSEELRGHVALTTESKSEFNRKSRLLRVLKKKVRRARGA